MGFADYDRAYRESSGRQYNTFVPPPGDYQVKITDFKAIDGKLPRVKFTMKPLFGEFAGMPFEHTQFIRGSKSVDFLKGDIEALGEKIDGLSDLPAVGARFIGMIAEVTIKEVKGKDGKYHKNIYINRRLTEVDEQGMPVASDREEEAGAQEDWGGSFSEPEAPAESAPPPASAPPSSPPPSYSPPPDDDDIPF